MRALYAGVDVGGTKIACAIARDDGRVLTERQIPTDSQDGPAAVLARTAELVRELADGVGDVPAAIGVGMPGLVDVGRGVTMFLPNLPTQWREVPVRDVLASRLGCDVFVLNDARAATLGEWTFGHGRGVRDLVLFTLGTGIGGGLVLDGKLRLGPLGAAGELGHQTVLPDGLLCGCGNRGCLETVASGPAIVGEGVRLLRSGQAPRLHEAVGGDAARVTPATMAEAARAGDTSVCEAITRAAGFIGIGVANVVTAVHPQMVVFGGGVAELGNVLIDAIRAATAERVRMFPIADLRFERSELREKAGVMGALALAMRPELAASIRGSAADLVESRR